VGETADFALTTSNASSYMRQSIELDSGPASMAAADFGGFDRHPGRKKRLKNKRYLSDAKIGQSTVLGHCFLTRAPDASSIRDPGHGKRMALFSLLYRSRREACSSLFLGR
jgi:hypothetical protein